MSCPHAIAELTPRAAACACGRIRCESRWSAIPNVGKSVIFGRLTGRYVDGLQLPGHDGRRDLAAARSSAPKSATSSTRRASTRSKGALSEDERVTRELLSEGGAELIVQVADARNLRRALMLTSQIADFRLPMILVLNMIDEAHARGRRHRYRRTIRGARHSGDRGRRA